MTRFLDSLPGAVKFLLDAMALCCLMVGVVLAVAVLAVVVGA